MSKLAPDPVVQSGPLDLLVIQPTPFCNIDCSYCYLPTRQSKARITPAILDRIFERVFAGGLARHRFTVVWHAGEPLVLPISFYENAFDIIRSRNVDKIGVDHSFQTNGTLLTPEWCAFIKARSLRVGVSIDGPAFLHDAHRKTRQGKGTQGRVVEGIRLLQGHGIPFHVISVVTAEALDYPDEMFDFYVAHGIDQVAFNVEEVEGPHRNSSLQGGGMSERYSRFLSRFYDLAAAAGWPLRVREFDATLGAVFRGEGRDLSRTHETTPMAIVNVDHLGNFSTFSPELLGLPSDHYGDFALGNVADADFEAALSTPKFLAILGDIEAGVRRCRQECAYFSMCGGGAPVNKYFENGTFDSTETMFCRLNRQVLLDVVVEKLEAGALLPPPPEVQAAFSGAGA